MKKVALVTGAARGIGLATTVRFLEDGWRVAMLDVLGDALDAAVATLGRADDTMALAADVSDPQAVQAAVGRAHERFGRIDALVNNAGVALGGFLELVDEDELRALFDVNVFGAWALTRAALPALRRSPAPSVVFMSSMSGRMALPGLGAYAASKYALEALGEAWRHELRGQGVRVTLVEPGAYRTDIFGRNRRLARALAGAGEPYAALWRRTEQLYRERAEQRAGDPREVADLVLRLIAEPRPALRHPIGPYARLRTLALRVAPFGLIERLLARALHTRPT